MCEPFLHAQGRGRPLGTCKVKDTAEWEPKGLYQRSPLSKSKFTLELLRAAYLLCCTQHPPGVLSVKLFSRNFGQLEGSLSTEKRRSFLMLVIHHSLTLLCQAMQHVQGKQRFSNACKGSLTLGVACLEQATNVSATQVSNKVLA